MAKLVLNDLTNTYNVTKINENFTRIEAEFQDKVLYRNNTVGEANTLESDVDANSKRIINLLDVQTAELTLDGVAVGASIAQTLADTTTQQTIATTKASEANASASASAASAALSLSYLNDVKTRYYGALASNPVLDPLGQPVTIGDEYFNTTSNLLFRYNGTTWQASDINTANLAASGGAGLVGYDSGTVQTVLDDAKPMASYTALRAYTGTATGVRITAAGIAGFFQRSLTDMTSADNDGTIIVDAAGRRWMRLFNDSYHVDWWGPDRTGVTSSTTEVNAAIDYVSSVGGGVLQFGKGIYKGNFILKPQVVLIGYSHGGTRGLINTNDPLGVNYGTVMTPATATWVIDTPAGGALRSGIAGIDFKGGGLALPGGGVNLNNGTNGGIFRSMKFDGFADEALIGNGLVNVYEDLFGVNCLLTRARAEKTGVFRIEGFDNFINRIEGNTSITAIVSASLYLCGIYIGGANNYVMNLMGELSEIGVYVEECSGAVNRFVNCRADHNYGPGFVGGGRYTECYAYNNSKDSSGVYSGFVANGPFVQYTGCFAHAQTADGYVHKYGFEVGLNADINVITSQPQYIACNSIGHGTAGYEDNLTNGPGRLIPGHYFGGTSATPSVAGTTLYVPTNSAPVEITAFTGGVKGQQLTVMGNANVTLVRSASLLINGVNSAGKKTLRAGVAYMFVLDSLGAWVEQAGTVVARGTTAERPNSYGTAGLQYFDTTLGRPIWRNVANTGWVDAAGGAI
jgi:hypothetical protein